MVRSVIIIGKILFYPLVINSIFNRNAERPAGARSVVATI